MNRIVEELEQSIISKRNVNPIFAENPYTPLMQRKEPEQRPLRRTKSRTRYNDFNSDN